MKSISVETHRVCLNKCLSYFRFSGIWISDSSTPLRKLISLFCRLLSFFVLISYILTSMADLVVNCNDLVVIVDDSCFIAGAGSAFFKICTVIFKYQKFEKLISDIHDPVDVLRQSNDKGVMKIIKRCAFFETLDYYLWSNATFVLGFATIFLVTSQKGELPSRAIFPFDITRPSMYAVALSIQIYTVIYGLISLMAIEITMWGLLRWTTVQIQVLSCNYKNCDRNLSRRPRVSSQSQFDDIQKFNLSEIDDEEMEIKNFLLFENDKNNRQVDINCFQWRLRYCIKHHQRIVEIVNHLNDTLSTCLMVQLAVSTMIFCLNGFLAVTFPHDKKRLMRSIFFLLVGFIQIFYWCRFGNELKFQADYLTTSQWMSGWESNFNRNLKNYLTTAMIRTMKPVEIRAGGLFILSMETFISVNNYLDK
ncbi:uncharacterized protein LOC130672703 isoform X2 [Microplitis mediator]|uniref:uncharacterized protein LOC130672703 isoform X2 n=1 Tax=Microplitis mediator TaxID=375433 RepID=UPI0025545769|nr:uncharacterized protein LOC130672703 isoform X2 [Microplitis mediator]